MSVLGEKNRQVGPDCSLKNIFEGCRKRRDGSDYPMKAQIRVWPSHQFRRRAILGTATELSRRRFVQFRSLRCGIGGFTG
jgi:hypothetical protein